MILNMTHLGMIILSICYISLKTVDSYAICKSSFFRSTFKKSLTSIEVVKKDNEDSLDSNNLENDVTYINREELLKYWVESGKNLQNFDENIALINFINNEVDDEENDDSFEDFEDIKTSKFQSELGKLFNDNKKPGDLNIDSGISVGIDLGTSNSAISYIDNNTATLIPIEGSRTIPSVVSYLPDQKILVGKLALSRYLFCKTI
jgi:hypothetical protein